MAEGEEPVEGEEQMEGEDEELDEGEDGNEKKYVKKEYVAKPYHSDYVEKTVEDVEALSVKNSRQVKDLYLLALRGGFFAFKCLSGKNTEL